MAVPYAGLAPLASKADVDAAIRTTVNKVVVLRFGRAGDPECLRQDDILLRCERELVRMASIFTVDVDCVEAYATYFDIALIPSTIFFWNATHIKVDFGCTPDHTKFVGAFASKQDCINLIEVIFRGASRGKTIVASPIDPRNVPKYELLYKDF